ncbi:MAG: oxdD, partial [Candidatus Eremiobacteraeota bacterium]|nr:oxdD [Candidatus Eremiobacteraeota bacterium]
MEDQTPDAATSRGRFLGAAALVAATTALAARGASAQTVQEGLAGRNSAAITDPGPKNPALTNLFPDAYVPPITDHGLPPQFWSSFNTARRRIQGGGWARQVNVHDFPISKEIAGVNMRLDAGGIRELHWHVADEWAIMLTGHCRITALDYDGRPFVSDVNKGDLWYFPAGVPHSLQGLDPEGCEFLLVFDQGDFSEEDTTLISDWTVHTPHEVLSKNWGISISEVDKAMSQLPAAGRWIFQAPVPPALGADLRGAADGGPLSPTNFAFHTFSMQPTKQTKSGSVRVVDSTNFTVSKNIAMAYVALKPGGLRELHWHPDADEWQYWISGKGRMTVFFNASTARTQDFNAGDLAYVPRTLGHYIENTGSEDLIFLEMFKTPK